MIINNTNIARINTYQSRIHEFSQQMIERNKLSSPYLWSLVDLFYYLENNKDSNERDIENTIFNLFLKMDFLKKDNIVNAPYISKDKTENEFQSLFTSTQNEEKVFQKLIYSTITKNLSFGRKTIPVTRLNKFVKQYYFYYKREEDNRNSIQDYKRKYLKLIQNSFLNRKTDNIDKTLMQAHILSYEKSEMQGGILEKDIASKSVYPKNINMESNSRYVNEFINLIYKQNYISNLENESELLSNSSSHDLNVKNYLTNLEYENYIKYKRLIKSIKNIRNSNMNNNRKYNYTNNNYEKDNISKNFINYKKHNNYFRDIINETFTNYMESEKLTNTIINPKFINSKYNVSFSFIKDKRVSINSDENNNKYFIKDKIDYFNNIKSTNDIDDRINNYKNIINKYNKNLGNEESFIIKLVKAVNTNNTNIFNTNEILKHLEHIDSGKSLTYLKYLKSYFSNSDFIKNTEFKQTKILNTIKTEETLNNDSLINYIGEEIRNEINSSKEINNSFSIKKSEKDINLREIYNFINLYKTNIRKYNKFFDQLNSLDYSSKINKSKNISYENNINIENNKKLSNSVNDLYNIRRSNYITLENEEDLIDPYSNKDLYNYNNIDAIIKIQNNKINKRTKNKNIKVTSIKDIRKTSELNNIRNTDFDLQTSTTNQENIITFINDESINKSIKKNIDRIINESINRNPIESINNIINKNVNKIIHDRIYDITYASTNIRTNESIDGSINESIYKNINESTNKTYEKWYRKYGIDNVINYVGYKSIYNSKLLMHKNPTISAKSINYIELLKRYINNTNSMKHMTMELGQEKILNYLKATEILYNRNFINYIKEDIRNYLSKSKEISNKAPINIEYDIIKKNTKRLKNYYKINDENYINYFNEFNKEDFLSKYSENSYIKDANKINKKYLKSVNVPETSMSFNENKGFYNINNIRLIKIIKNIKEIKFKRLKAINIKDTIIKNAGEKNKENIIDNLDSNYMINLFNHINKANHIDITKNENINRNIYGEYKAVQTAYFLNDKYYNNKVNKEISNNIRDIFPVKFLNYKMYSKQNLKYMNFDKHIEIDKYLNAFNKSGHIAYKDLIKYTELTTNLKDKNHIRYLDYKSYIENKEFIGNLNFKNKHNMLILKNLISSSDNNIKKLILNTRNKLIRQASIQQNSKINKIKYISTVKELLLREDNKKNELLNQVIKDTILYKLLQNNKDIKVQSFNNLLINKTNISHNNLFEKELRRKQIIFDKPNKQLSLQIYQEKLNTYEKRSEIVFRENKKEKETPPTKVETINKPINANIELDYSNKEVNDSQIFYIMNKVYEKLERKLKFEKQRRGL